VSDQNKLHYLGSSVHDLALAISELRIAVHQITQDVKLSEPQKTKANTALQAVHRHLDEFLSVRLIMIVIDLKLLRSVL
jgi:outer membrane murein-binding lipoprotein Lpp